MSFTEDEIAEFKTEALELLSSAEEALLALEQGADYRAKYDLMFRAFHSVKGASGMMEMTDLQGYVHHLETYLNSVKDEAALTKEQITYFLDGCDGTRSLLDGRPANPLPTFPGRATVTAIASAPSAAIVGAAAAAEVRAMTTTTVGRIVVLDDQPEITTVLSALLSMAGHEVHAFTDPRAAIKFVIHNDVDVVFTDVNMPEIDGVQVLESVRKINSEIPVVFVTGGCSREDLIRAIGLGVFAVIEKPWRNEQVQNMVDKAVRLRRLNDLVNSSMAVLMAQYTTFDAHLKATANHDQRSKLKSDVLRLLDQRKSLRRGA